MPTISWFYGIAIRMCLLDHPPPRFQAIYGEHEANVSIETGEAIEGQLGPRRWLKSLVSKSLAASNCASFSATAAKACTTSRAW
jgi:uncharacterized protein DUF4160